MEIFNKNGYICMHNNILKNNMQSKETSTILENNIKNYNSQIMSGINEIDESEHIIIFNYILINELVNKNVISVSNFNKLKKNTKEIFYSNVFNIF